MSFDPGTQVGEYEVLGVAGVGGMGAVYRVRNLLSDRVDAMKVVSDLAASPELADRFLREIRVHARLRHPNIASLYTAFRFRDQIVMILEFVEGATVDAYLAGGPLDGASVAACMVQVLSALEYAHGQGVIHRDIKPANIAVTADGVVKLLDFGIARDVGDLGVTAVGTAVGSLYYMSPEQVTGQPLDGRSDLYSVGLTIHEMLTGRRAVAGENGWAVMQAQIGVVPPPPSRINPAVPRELSDLVMRAIAKRPADRFQSAAEFRAALAAFRSGSTAAPAPLPTGGAFTAEVLARLERCLVPFLGPISGHVVRKASRESPSLQELTRRLAVEIPTERERRAFFRACASDVGADALSDTARLSMATTSLTTASPTAAIWDPAVLERVRSELAEHVGPLAKVLVSRAAHTARDEDELYTLLSAEIASDRGREAFLAGRTRGAKP